MTDTQRCLDPGCHDGPALPDGTPGPRNATDGLLCRRCTATLERRLAELPARRDALRGVLAGAQTGGGGGSSRPKPGSRPPINVAAHDHLQHLHALAVSWVRLVCEERDLRGPDRNDVTALAPWLLAQLDWITRQGWVGDLAEEMRDAARVADGITRALPAWHRLDVACPRCDARDLGRWDGDDVVRCASCDSAWDEDHYRLLVAAAVHDERATLTARQAAARLQVPAGTFRRWATTGVIKAIGKVDGLHRYATADVERLAEEEGAA